MMATAYTHVTFEEVNGKTVCVIWVDDSPDPVYFEADDERNSTLGRGVLLSR